MEALAYKAEHLVHGSAPPDEVGQENPGFFLIVVNAAAVVAREAFALRFRDPHEANGKVDHVAIGVAWKGGELVIRK
jgi:hypothetical protein